MDQEKRLLRKLKRAVKQAGNRKRRRALDRNLRDDPAGAAAVPFMFGHDSSTGLNGLDKDSTRRREE